MQTLHTQNIDHKWLGSPVQHFRGSFPEIENHIPTLATTCINIVQFR
jgi:hypothetical protein